LLHELLAFLQFNSTNNEEGGSKPLRQVRNILPIAMASYFTRLEPSGRNSLLSGRHDLSEPEYAVSRAEDIKGS
jgi:hypothetical protein